MPAAGPACYLVDMKSTATRLAILALALASFLFGGCQSAQRPVSADDAFCTSAATASVFGGLVGRESLSHVTLPTEADDAIRTAADAKRPSLDQRAYVAWIQANRS